mmetsp:Transcript_20923/g.49574  ORF Transcript_20923/g.49574 Transcript_20923/m.49574 type:complete len:182 (+) Transcript_20923:199-744(+)|eukprot:CAMPEP_0197178796 /NCGR_PEP_ID=MMETSP1423-20130617/3968_1 /TAXON_ID=476441 /ORGANISM="Pseudo-nitzschia heimii, Strain UNC1101" /LENGTH=181 /DNA_ID=CAMNT_0042628609 /DNA_START=177 /DNA_END=722 /DNA_ORIENTATION=-
MDVLDSVLQPLGEMLGVPPIAAGVAVLVVVLTTLYFVLGGGGAGGKTVHIAMDVALHPKHLEYMKRKEAKYCNDDFGKGLRCIFDYLREQEEDHVKAIFDEPPAFEDESEYETHNINVHPGQFDFFAEKGYPVSEVPGEEFKELSRISRALLDWAMRKEAEKDSQDATLFVQIRCLNCLCT